VPSLSLGAADVGGPACRWSKPLWLSIEKYSGVPRRSWTTEYFDDGSRLRAHATSWAWLPRAARRASGSRQTSPWELRINAQDFVTRGLQALWYAEIAERADTLPVLRQPGSKRPSASPPPSRCRCVPVPPMPRDVARSEGSEWAAESGLAATQETRRRL